MKKFELDILNWACQNMTPEEIANIDESDFSGRLLIVPNIDGNDNLLEVIDDYDYIGGEDYFGSPIEFFVVLESSEEVGRFADGPDMYDEIEAILSKQSHFKYKIGVAEHLHEISIEGVKEYSAIDAIKLYVEAAKLLVDNIPYTVIVASANGNISSSNRRGIPKDVIDLIEGQHNPIDEKPIIMYIDEYEDHEIEMWDSLTGRFLITPENYSEDGKLLSLDQYDNLQMITDFTFMAGPERYENGRNYLSEDDLPNEWFENAIKRIIKLPEFDSIKGFYEPQENSYEIVFKSKTYMGEAYAIFLNLVEHLQKDGMPFPIVLVETTVEPGGKNRTISDVATDAQNVSEPVRPKPSKPRKYDDDEDEDEDEDDDEDYEEEEYSENEIIIYGPERYKVIRKDDDKVYRVMADGSEVFLGTAESIGRGQYFGSFEDLTDFVFDSLRAALSWLDECYRSKNGDGQFYKFQQLLKRRGAR